MVREYLFDLGKIVEGAANGDFEKIIAYGDQLAKRLADDGEPEGAKRLRAILSRSKAQKFSVARTSQQAAPLLPVDGESRMAIADEENWQPGQVPLFLPAPQQQQADRFLKYVRAADRLAANGVGVSASLLVYGPPGCGKTQLARYIAAELSLPLLTARSDALISSYLGSTAKNIRSLFEHAASRRCVLFLDEFDALAKMRDDKRELGELKRVVISLLQNIDALGPDHLIIAATNHEHLLDPAIWRRFAYRMQLTEPDESGRGRMLATFLGRFASPEQVEMLAAISAGSTGAALKHAAEDAIRDAVLDGRSQIDALVMIDKLLQDQGKNGTPISRDDKIRLVRAKDPKKFSQPLLASMFGVSQSHVSKVLNRKSGADD
jgi:MoxR-like ATPase